MLGGVLPGRGEHFAGLEMQLQGIAECYDVLYQLIDPCLLEWCIVRSSRQRTEK